MPPIFLKPGKSRRDLYLLWGERLLLAVGLLCLSLFAYAKIDAKWFEYRQNRALDEALAAKAQEPVASAAGAQGVSATDHLDTFQPVPAAVPAPIDEGSLLGRIEISRLGISSLVLEGVESATLRRGVGHIPNTAMPETNGKNGNVGLAAHRDTIFRGLKDVRKGDRVTIESMSGTSTYSVDWTRVVKPDDVSVLTSSDKPELTLVTCYPFYYIGSAPERFIVRAHRIDTKL
jgi:sortase A